MLIAAEVRAITTGNPLFLGYYSSWGDVAMFYDNHRYSNRLVKLGKIESGLELLDSIDEDFSVSIERMD